MISRSLLAVIGILSFAAYIVLNPAFDLTTRHLGKERFYTYVDNTTHNLRKNARQYEYDLLAINDRGQQKLVTLTVDHELYPHSYLRLYLNSHSKITDWEEIRRETLPSRLTEQFKQL
jgi:uncharacterized protein (TIGR01655 family)